jgi:hypothetical protein
MKLRWDSSSRDHWNAYAGKIRIGSVFVKLDKTIGYKVDGVYMRWVGKASGDVSSIPSGKRSVERAWQQWLTAAGIGGEALTENSTKG